MDTTKEKEIIEEIDDQSLSLMEDSPEESSEILYEDTSKRSENVKHFRMKNGTYMAAVYDKPIHILDKSTGKFVDMAHHFEAKEDCYEAETNHFKVRFPKKEGKRKYVTVEKGERSVSWRYIPTIDSHKKRAEAAVHEHRRTSLAELPQFPKLTYEKTEAQTDLEYGISEKGVKENIILTKRPKSNIFRFELKLVGLKAVLAEDKQSIRLYADDAENGEPEFEIPPINMTDSAGVYSEAAHYELTEDESGTVMAIIIDTDWLFAEERLYPVTVDPQVLVTNVAEATSFEEFFTLSQAQGALTNNAVAYMAGYDKDGNEYRIYLKPQYPLLPDGYTITSAKLNLHQHDYVGYATYELRRITSDWDKSSITWRKQPDHVATGKTVTSVNRAAATVVSLDITHEVKSIYLSRLKNYGLLIKSTNSSKPCVATTECYCDKCCRCTTCTTCTNCQQFWSVYSRTSKSYAPSIEIQYTLVDEYADHQKYESFNVGRAGSGSVNLFTGRLSFTHNDVAASGSKMPLTLSHVYRSDYAELDHRDTTYGKGWFLSAAQTLAKSNSNEVHSIYTDAQGKKHYFSKVRTTPCGIIVYDDSAGLGLTLVDEHKIIDDKGNTMTFTDGRLSEIKDADENSITMTYDSQERLSQVKDSIGRTATLHYDATGKLDYIKDTKGRKINYTYDDNNNLIQIDYPSDPNKTSDNAKTVFNYAIGAKLTKVTDQSGIYYEIGYLGTYVETITRRGTKSVSQTSVSESTAAKDGGGISITYRNTSTMVEDQWTQIRTVYRFDECGRVTCVYEDLTNNRSLAKSGITVTDLREYEIAHNRETGEETEGKYTSLTARIAGTDDMHPNYLSNGNFASGTSGWTISGSSNGSISTDGYPSGYKSYRFNGSSTQRLEQTVDFKNITVRGNVLVASAWAKSTDSTPNKFELYAKLTYTDGTIVENTGKFDSKCADEWQYVAIPLRIEYGKIPSKVIVKFDCTGSSTCYISNIRLTETQGLLTRIDYNLNKSQKVFNDSQSLKYSVTQNDNINKQVTYYNNSSDAVMSVITDKENNTFSTYALYDEKHHLVRTKDYRSKETVRSYDKFGNEWWRKYYASNDADTDLSYICKYNDKTSRLEYVYDPRGKEFSTRFNYDSEGELLKRKIDSNGQEFDYSHDQYTDLQTSVTAQDAHSCCDVKNSFIYNQYYLTRVNHNDFNFDFAYDALGRSSSIKVANANLVSFAYSDKAETSTVTATYANNTPVVTTYDSRGNVWKKSINGNLVFEAVYNGTGVLTKTIDFLHDRCYTYAYNKDGNVTRIDETSQKYGSAIGYQTFAYDEGKHLVSSYDSRTGFTHIPEYEKVNGHFAPDNTILGFELQNKFIDKVDLDGLRRVSARKLTLANSSSPLMTDTYGYLKSTTCPTTEWTTQHQTEYVGSLTHKVGTKSSTLTYTYDRVGNIETVSGDSGELVKYTYDRLNRLIQENNYKASRRYVWTYDKGGNITSKKEYKLTSSGSLGDLVSTNTYTYDTAWKDKLSQFDGQTISYDSLGNPTTYRGKALAWTNVRRLASYGDIDFEYNAEGIRTAKISNGVKTTYTLDGNQILKESNSSKTLVYYYGNSDIIGFRYNNTDYFYEKNLQGDVTAVYNSAGTCVAEYQYDAWGKVLEVSNKTSANIGDINPFRYKSYYYDTETGLYYLESRYYDPEVGRFINSDSVAYLGKGKELVNYNLFAYCSNNPVNRVDYAGTSDENGDGRTDDEDNDFKSDEKDPCISAGASFGKISGSSNGNDNSGTIQNISRSPTGISHPLNQTANELPQKQQQDSTRYQTYYHVTTAENAALIAETGKMKGSDLEGGYVYAWRSCPNQYAIKNSGAHQGVTISFKTSATFSNDPGISNPKVLKFGPVVSDRPGPICVFDVQIIK